MPKIATRIVMTAILPLVAAVHATSALAHHVSIGTPTGEAGPITTVSADVGKQGSLSLGAEVYIEDYDSFRDEELIEFAEAGFDGVHNTDTAYVTKLSLDYVLLEKLSINAVLPYFVRDGIREAEHDHALHGHEAANDVHSLGTASGVGDLQIGAKFGLLDRRNDPIGLAIIAGLNVPTGDTRERQNSGSRFETEFQPGSGSWDPKAGLAISKSFGSLSLDASGVYTLRTEGTQDTNLGDHFAFDAAASWRIGKGPHVHHDGTYERHSALDLILELNGEWEERERVGGFRDPNSGGTQLFVSPGARYVSAKGWNAYAAVAIPVHDDLNGIQNETDIRMKLGINVSF